MFDHLPDSTQLFQAIDAYLARAYPAGAQNVPAAVAARLKAMREATEIKAGRWCDCLDVERDDAQNPARFGIRLGNAFYPHMKIVVERRPDGLGWLFRVDTHDQHICPLPDSREYAIFKELMVKNQQLASQIESDWQNIGIPTFKTYLRQDLAKRAGSVQPSAVSKERNNKPR